MSTKEKTDKVLRSLENAKYKWRTIEGISKEIGESTNDIWEIIDQNSDVVIESSVRSNTGLRLFTTKKHFENTSSSIEKLFGAFKGRIR